MPATIDAQEGGQAAHPQTLPRMRARLHAHCWVCGSSNERGLEVRFEEDATGAVEAWFSCDPSYTGYEGLLHGGVVSALLDGAMTNCMLAHECVAVTADLQVRFREPVRVGQPARIRAWIVHRRRKTCVLRAELVQEGQLRATALGRFMKHPNAH